jgi:hypothetical protein
MGRCRYELLKDLEPALDEIRKIEGLVEKKAGIFYLKSQSFMHFHEKDGKIWADVRDGETWGEPITVPDKIIKTFHRKFVNLVFKGIRKS